MSFQKFDFVGLNIAAVNHLHKILLEELPGGKIVGHEYRCADIDGGPGTSFCVSLQTGAWYDHADEDMKGGDVASLMAKKHGLPQLEAAKYLANRLGIDFSKPIDVQHTKRSLPTTAITVPPIGAPIPSMKHPRFGSYSAYWVYRDSKGEPLFYVSRHDYLDDKGQKTKSFLPWSYSPLAKRFVNKGFPEPRPLYGLELLERRPKASILLVEGEKACDAARTLLSGAYVVMTWSNGSKAFSKTDFSPIYGRNVLLWPDADEPGLRAMHGVASLLHSHCPQIKIINPTDHAGGWDAADAVNEGMTKEQVIAWAKDKVHTFAAPKEPEVLPAEEDTTILEEIETAQDNENGGPTTEHHAMIWARARLAVTDSGVPFMNHDNCMRLFKVDETLSSLLWFDEFHRKVFTEWGGRGVRLWSDVDDISLLIYFQRRLDFHKIAKESVRDAAMEWAHSHPKNEPRDWMESLSWDGVPRVLDFMTNGFGSVQSEFIQAVSKNFWVSMVARIYSPGCKADHMLVLEGAQGTFKSTALSVIGGKWYGQTVSKPGDKDFLQGLVGKMLLEVAELSSFRKSDRDTIKQVLSNTADDFRPSYGRHVMHFPRTCVFAGTTNEDTYLDDPTGGRRFWPVVVGKIDLDYITKHRDQLFAEAVQLYKQGENWYAVPQSMALIEQDKRRHHDEWQDEIEAWCSKKTYVTIQKIAKDCIGMQLDKLDRRVEMRIANCLKAIGRKKIRMTVQGDKRNFWVPLDYCGPSPSGNEELEELPFT